MEKIERERERETKKDQKFRKHTDIQIFFFFRKEMFLFSIVSFDFFPLLDRWIFLFVLLQTKLQNKILGEQSLEIKVEEVKNKHIIFFP